MPLRSLASPVLKWPSREAVLAAAEAWAQELRARDPKVLRIVLFGSYARGDASVGSDLDMAVVVRDGEGGALFDVSRLPVPADVVVFEERQWEQLAGQATGIGRAISRDGRALAI